MDLYKNYRNKGEMNECKKTTLLQNDGGKEDRVVLSFFSAVVLCSPFLGLFISALCW